MRLTRRGARAVVTAEVIIGRGITVLLAVSGGLIWVLVVHMVRSQQAAGAAALAGMWLVAGLPAFAVHAHSTATRFPHRPPPRRVWLPFTVAAVVVLATTVAQWQLVGPQESLSDLRLGLVALLTTHSVAGILAAVVGIRVVHQRHRRQHGVPAPIDDLIDEPPA